MKFYNRTEELGEIGRYWEISKNQGIMLAIYGRRRVGKTELIKEAFRKKDIFYFFVKKLQKNQVIGEFSEGLAQYIKTPLGKFDDLGKPLEILFERAKNEHTVLVIDEFQNFGDIDKSAFSLFQYLWDKHAKTSKILLILIGSYVGMMKKIFFDNREPLYGRAYAKYDILPLKFGAVSEILSDLKFKDKKEIIELYSIFGGIPRYYNIIETENLRGAKPMVILDMILLKDNAILKNEVMDILAQEFGTSRRAYYSIIQAIALGKSAPSEIADAAGIEKTSLPKYLEELESEYEIIERKVPISEQNPEKSKKGRYFIKDNFFRFWFRVIYRNMSYYELGNYGYVRQKIAEQLPAFVGKSFEDIAKQSLIRLNAEKKLPFAFSKIGSWWSGAGDEIDIVAIGNSAALFCECKWEQKKLGFPEFNRLKEVSDMSAAEMGCCKKYYAFFSKAGFESKFSEFAEKNGILLFKADGLV